MTGEHADRYVAEALLSHQDWDSFEVVAGERSLPALVEAFARRGWTATAQARPGLLLVEQTISTEAAPAATGINGAEVL